MHWAVKYIGLPHKEGGRGPEGWDCWGLMRLIYGREFKIDLPSYPGISESSIHTIHSKIREALLGDWKRVEEPFDGCAVGMSQLKLGIHHVGIYTKADGGKVIHCWKAHNVVADSLRGLGLKGFRLIQFYQHSKWLT